MHAPLSIALGLLLVATAAEACEPQGEPWLPWGEAREQLSAPPQPPWRGPKCQASSSVLAKRMRWMASTSIRRSSCDAILAAFRGEMVTPLRCDPAVLAKGHAFAGGSVSIGRM